MSNLALGRIEVMQLLNQLEELHAERDALRLQKQECIERVYTNEIKEKIDAIEAEFSPLSAAVDANITALEAKVKGEVLKIGETVKGTHLMAVYNKPRVSWNTDKLEGLALAIPKILDAREVGKPSVTIRKR